MYWRLLFLIAFCVCLGQATYIARKGFSIRKLQGAIDTTAEPLSLQMQTILQQPFYFIGKGRQCFAFASLDNKYVLKLPRTNIYRVSFWARWLPMHHKRKRMLEHKLERKNFVWNSFRIASTLLAEETGTIALHLGTSKEWQGEMTLIDALGVPLRIPVHKTCFAIQHKRPLWTAQFLEALKAKDREKQVRLLHALMDAIERRARKGVLNRDRSFLKNYGYDGNMAYQIDVGDFYRLPTWYPEQVFLKSIHDSAAPVQEWLQELDPSLLPVVRERLRNLHFHTD